MTGVPESLIGSKVRVHDDPSYGLIHSAKVIDMYDVPVGTLCVCYFTVYFAEAALKCKLERGTVMIWLGNERFLSPVGIVHLLQFMWVSWWP